MARLRQNERGSEIAIVQLAGLVILALFLLPQVRQVVLTFRGILILVIVLGVALGVLLRFLYLKEEKALSKAFGSIPPQIEARKCLSPKTFAERVTNADWYQFERLVARLYETHGYKVERRGGARPDGGIDMTIFKDGSITAVQCKQWRSWKIGLGQVRELLGAMTHEHISRGIIVGVRDFTTEARLFAPEHNIQLLDRTMLDSMFRTCSTWNDPETAEILRTDIKLCPQCDRLMVLRTASRGGRAGKPFWGCSAYPRCRAKMPM